MKRSKCPHCGAEVAKVSYAYACPHCYKLVRSVIATSKQSLPLGAEGEGLYPPWRKVIRAITRPLRLVWRISQGVVRAIKEQRRQSGLRAFEAERLDRLRNPSKYAGK